MLRRSAFTLVELLVVLGVIAVLVGVLLPTLSGARRRAQATACLSQQRQVGLALVMYTQQHDGLFPRSSHSATASQMRPWGRALMPLLTSGEFVAPGGGPAWAELFNSLYRCPADGRRQTTAWSYGKSVYFELTALETGGPTWHKITQIRRPTHVAMFGEVLTSPGADHFMAHFWPMGADPEIDLVRHGDDASPTQTYLFTDGHAEAMPFARTYDPSRNLDLWNPDLAD